MLSSGYIVFMGSRPCLVAISEFASGGPGAPALLAVDGVCHLDVGHRVQQAIQLAIDAGGVHGVDLHTASVGGAVVVVAHGAGSEAALGLADRKGLGAALCGPQGVYGVLTSSGSCRRLWGRC